SYGDSYSTLFISFFFFFQAEDVIRARNVTAVQTCALPICLGDHGQEVRVPAPPRHDMLVEVGGDAGPGDGPLVHAQVESVRAGHGADDPHGLLRELGELNGLVLGQIRVVGHMTVGADEQVSGIVRVEVEHREHRLTAADDES